MNSVTTDNILPVYNPLDAVQTCRADAITETNQRELYQSIAPRIEAGLYLVPKVIE
jgi:aspartyl-tRNA(Asn)/glutamyl-tRNA(Gln) amidotransferase subunit C